MVVDWGLMNDDMLRIDDITLNLVAAMLKFKMAALAK